LPRRRPERAPAKIMIEIIEVLAAGMKIFSK